VTITKGTTVTWVRGAGDDGSAPHTITCGTANNPKLGDCAKAPFNVDYPSGTKKVSRTFNTAGTYMYLCVIHPVTMVGTIKVTP
jgi:plastocyanin